MAVSRSSRNAANSKRVRLPKLWLIFIMLAAWYSSCAPCRRIYILLLLLQFAVMKDSRASIRLSIFVAIGLQKIENTSRYALDISQPGDLPVLCLIHARRRIFLDRKVYILSLLQATSSCRWPRFYPAGRTGSFVRDGGAAAVAPWHFFTIVVSEGSSRVLWYSWSVLVILVVGPCTCYL